MTRLKCFPFQWRHQVKWTDYKNGNVLHIFRRTRIQKHVQQFHIIEHWMSTTERGSNTCMILLKWKLSLISMHLDCLLNFTTASWMMIRKNLPKNIWKCRRQELCHCYTISVAWQPGICFNSKGSVYKKHQCFSRF